LPPSTCSGKCDIEATGNPADRVYGVIFRIATAEERALDEAEGVGHGYRKDEITVMTFEGTLAAMAQGAAENALPATYIELIRAVPSQIDPNTARRQRNEALLPGISQ
jgi:gamma-glutamylcyclotransferase